MTRARVELAGIMERRKGLQRQLRCLPQGGWQGAGPIKA